MTDAPRLMRIALDPSEMEEWTAAMTTVLAEEEMPVEIAPAGTPDAEIDYLVYNYDSGVHDFAPFARLRAILNTWAGVEAVVGKIAWPEHVPFCRMVEPGLTEGMVEYFAGHAMRYHLDIDRFQANSAAGRWDKWSPPLARDRTVGVLGLGALGRATAERLVAMGFRVTGWARSAKDIPGVTCHHGAEGLMALLNSAEILVVILPLTPDTTNVLNAETLAYLPEGACIINAGRGPLIDDDALLAALASGHVRHATLDVFREEPLPQAHPYWRHPGVTVTPHIAAVTRARTACQAITAQIRRDLAGQTLCHIVDPVRGY
ncbi:MAG: glyoxylate/hydroxypyruvate reductase A [Pseudomonadota bacterium]